MSQEEETEIIDVKLPRELVERLCSKKLMQMLEAAWLDAFSRGSEFGMALVSTAQAANKEARRKKRAAKRNAKKS